MEGKEIETTEEAISKLKGTTDEMKQI